MATFRTTQGRAVAHCHVGMDTEECDWLRAVTDEEAEAASDWVTRHFPGVTEVRPATLNYNCFGRAFARRHGWFEISRTFLDDDFEPGSLDAPAVGDVVLYKRGSRIRHAAVVTLVENGEIKQLISKWGGMPEVLHGLDEVPARYGPAVALHKRRPSGLHFVAGAEEKDAGGEDMSEDEFSSAFRQFLSRDTHFELMLSSTREGREDIIASLPEVQMLLERSPDADDAVVEFFQKDDTQNNPDAAGIALYLLQHMPSEAAARAVALHIDQGRVSNVNRQLAAQAFLASADIQHDEVEDIVEVAAREAKAFLSGK